MFYSILFPCCFIALVMIVWFKSDAFVDWCNLFGLGKLIKSNHFKVERMSDVTLTYPRFLKLKYDKFIFKILSCPLCLSVWLSAILSIPISILLTMALVTLTVLEISFFGLFMLELVSFLLVVP